MTASDWATVIYSYFFVSAGIGSVLWFIAKKAINHVIEESMEDIKTIKYEMTPNHGSSIHDKINLEIIPMLIDLRTNQDKIKTSVAKLEGRFEQHVEEGD
jgi:hypothetical protein